jgi:hypothetical protein
MTYYRSSNSNRKQQPIPVLSPRLQSAQAIVRLSCRYIPWYFLPRHAKYRIVEIDLLVAIATWYSMDFVHTFMRPLVCNLQRNPFPFFANHSTVKIEILAASAATKRINHFCLSVFWLPFVLHRYL